MKKTGVFLSTGAVYCRIKFVAVATIGSHGEKRIRCFWTELLQVFWILIGKTLFDVFNPCYRLLYHYIWI